MGFRGLARWIPVAAVFLALGCEEVAIVVPKGAAEPVRFGASEIECVLKAKGILFRRADSARKDAPVCIILKVASPGDEGVPNPAESYVIRKEASDKRCAIAAIGRDAAGAMYAALDLAEQLGRVRSVSDLADAVEERSKSPFLRIRGVNPFILKDGLEKDSSYFHSLDYWQKYLDMLARSRYNFLDLHACYDVMTTDFLNIFPYLVRSERFPQAVANGVEPEKNLAMLKKIIEMARARGIKVGLMNYVGGAAEVPPNRLAEYTRECVAKLLKECPNLDTVGFRIGESGQKEDFFEESYAAGIADAHQEVNVYTRTWLASRTKIMEIADKYPGRFFVEIKYNGEHLGMPYIVAGERVSGWGSASYLDYSNYPRNYEIIYQIMANGTHRIFTWGDPDFASRCVKSCAFAEGAGFSMEPMTACYPQTNYFVNTDELGEPFFKWAFERNWFWYMLWGRMAYDPDTPERVWIGEFERRFGKGAGEDIYRAVALSSKVVPLIYSYHCLGADRRSMAPELETGDDHRRRRLADGKMQVDWQGDILDFVKVGVLDDTVMMTVGDYVESEIAGTPSGKLGPLDVARMLSEISLSAMEQIEKAEGTVLRGEQEYRFLRLDIQALSCLAMYYAEKIQAAVALERYRRTTHYELLTDALDRAHTAAVAWGALSEVTARHYRPLVERLRMCMAQFTWAEEGAHLSGDLLAIRRLNDEFKRTMFREGLKEFTKFIEELKGHGQEVREELVRKHEAMRKRAAEEPPRINHFPVSRALSGRPVRIAATVATIAENVPKWLFYRRAGEKDFVKIPMSPREDEYICAAFIPVEAVSPGIIEYYIEAGSPKSTAFWPDKGPETPHRIFIAADEKKPTIEPMALDEQMRGSKVEIRAKIKDESGIAAARVRYKVTPSFNDWQTADMKLSGDVFEADVPLTPEGILYYFEAVDKNGNTTIYPNFLERTPYYVIKSWAPAWIEHEFLSLPEGIATYRPAAGEHPFSDSEIRIEAISVELKDLIGIKLPEKAARKASLYNGEGYVVRFKLPSPARMFVGFGKREMSGWSTRQPGWVALEGMDLKVGEHHLDVCCRDFPPGEHSFAFTAGSGVILGFRKLKPDEKRIEAPFLMMNGKKEYEVLKQDYLTVPADMEIYSPKFGAVVCTDQAHLIMMMPKELEGLLGIRFSDARARMGDFEIPFKLDVPARVYAVFEKPGCEGWDEPHEDFALYKKDAYRQSEGGLRDIYCKDFPAGQSSLILKKGTAVILGFRKLSQIEGK